MRLHPAVLILIWCVLAAALQMLLPDKLLMASGMILLCAFILSKHKFILLLRRTRWVMLSLLLIYAYSTHGQALFEPLGIFSPTREGLSDGVLQLLRLLAALAGLAILLEHLHRQKLIAGLYTLFAPLQWLGMSRERLAVRLALTLHYAEATMLRGTSDWQATLRSLFAPHEEPMKQIELSLYRFGIIDAVLLLVAITAAWMLLR
jgi:energy-coupling factor transporter transmembrane protein EcfT